ncbi:tyrosine-type recombinase/integrase [bacterium]|nr:tyrosine-type recombinase/integrase [bacterium]MBU1985082.1 tyrosine-type recombinase/integrase [bacterium]
MWDIRYWISGKRKVFTIGETDRRTAMKIYAEFCRKHAGEKLDGTAIITEDSAEPVTGPHLSDLAVQVRLYAESNKSPKTLEREQLALSQIIRALGDISLSEITPAKIEEYKAARLKAAAPQTVNIEIRVLNTALNQAVEQQWWNNLPSSRFRQIRLPEAEPPEWLVEQQIEQLLATEDDEFRDFLLFLLHTGCRRNEALGVRWEDVDLGRRQVVIRGRVGKMGKRRTIPINDALQGVLSAWSRPRAEQLFPNYGPNQVSMKFRRWSRQIGLPTGISLHSLRATFACHLIKNGVDIYTVSRLLGHSSVKVTEKHYLALDPDHVMLAINILNFGGKAHPTG